MVIDPAIGLFVVADGMGGHNAGEVASALAVKTLHEFLARAADASESTLAEALCLANDQVLSAAAGNSTYEGMGTTVVAACVSDGSLVFGNVGDSRIYLMRAGALQQLTDDDSWVSRVLPAEAIGSDEASRHPMRHVLTNVLGAREPGTRAQIASSALSPSALASATGWHDVKIISQRLGHSPVAITLDTYAHVLPAADEKVAHSLANVILGSE